MDEKALIEAAVKQITEDTRLTTRWVDNFERELDGMNPLDIADVAVTALTYLEGKLQKDKFPRGASLARQAATIANKIGDELMVRK